MKFINTKTAGSRPRALLTPIITSAAVILALGLSDCSSKSGVGSNSMNANLKQIQIPMALNLVPPLALDLENNPGMMGLGLGGLGLVDTATSLAVAVTGCASGYNVGTVTPQTITSVVNLYNGDQNCLVKLVSFSFESKTYSALATGATNFTTWTAGSVATFANTILSTDLIKVFVGTQVSSPVTGSSTVVYNFTDISAGTSDNVLQSAVSTAVPLSATGRQPPNLSILQTRYLSTNSNGSGNMSFTLTCGVNVTGTSPAFSCPQALDTVQSTDVLSTEIDYILVPDVYAACKTSPTTLTVAQANSIFSSPPSSAVVQTITAVLSSTSGGGSIGEIGVAGLDNWGNTVANGGFDSASVITGVNPIYGSGASAGTADGTYANGYQNLNDIFIIRRKDSGGNALSFLYYCVDLAAITQS